MSSPEQLELFYSSFSEMALRKNASLAPRNLIVDGLKPLLASDRAIMFTESYDGTPSNMVIVDVVGMPWYAVGTRSVANVEGKVHGAAQWTHFEIMRHMRDRGKKFYDLGGCEGPVPVEGHPNHGVWHFKYGFRAPYVEFLPFFRKYRGPTGAVLDAVHRYRGDFC